MTNTKTNTLSLVDYSLTGLQLGLCRIMNWMGLFALYCVQNASGGLGVVVDNKGFPLPFIPKLPFDKIDPWVKVFITILHTKVNFVIFVTAVNSFVIITQRNTNNNILFSDLYSILSVSFMENFFKSV